MSEPDFVRTFADRAREHPDRTAITAVRWTGDEMADESLTYGELDRAARSLAAWLNRRCRPGDRALLLYPSGLEQVRAQLACLYAGLLPVAAPVPLGRKHHLTPATALAFDAEVSVILTDSATVGVVSDWMRQDGLPDVPLATTDTIADADVATWIPPVRPPDSPVLLQYIACSSADPKGVLVSNANLVANLDLVRRAFGLGPDDRCCGWLPRQQSHQLIGVLLAPLWLGASVVLMDRDDLFDQPYRWLRAMDRYGGTVTIAHRHAYDLCVRDLTEERVRRLDLTRWRRAVHIGEDITPETLRGFAEKLADAGLPTDAAQYAYLRPEATFLVRSSGGGTGASDGQRVRVVDPVTRQVLPPGNLGEIWIRGSDVATRYWRRPSETDRAFRAVTSCGASGYLRSGDLGMVCDGEVYVVGSIRDMLPAEGRVVHAQSLEDEVAALDDAFDGLTCGVFVLQDQGRAVAVVQEVHSAGLARPDLTASARRVLAHVRLRLSAPMVSVVLVRPGGVPRTPAGRANRSLLRELFLADALEPVYELLDEEVRRRHRPVLAS